MLFTWVHVLAYAAEDEFSSGVIFVIWVELSSETKQKISCKGKEFESLIHAP